MRGIRSCTYTNSDCYADADANSNSYSYAHAYTYTYTHTNANPMLGAVYTDAAPSPQPAAAPVA